MPHFHSAQQRELLYLPFFIWYVAEWLVLCLKYRNGTSISNIAGGITIGSRPVTAWQ